MVVSLNTSQAETLGRLFFDRRFPQCKFNECEKKQQHAVLKEARNTKSEKGID
jgi:hypothetical protein